VWAALDAAGPALRAAGQLPASATGSVVQLNRSRGGVPKAAVPEVIVGWRGVEGDVQSARQHHGRPWQALCIWAIEVIDAFNEAGHHLSPGAAGENITLEGIPWADVRPGVRLRMGTVLCEVWAFAEPCSNNAQWFTGGDFRLMHQSKGPVSRVYATVLEPGRIAAGDPAILEP
jgi:MOSC domain-containing protein YiiM